MHVQPVLTGLRAALEQHRVLAAGDDVVDEAVGALIHALEPAFRLAAFELAQQAAVEVGAQLDDRAIDVVVVDGDPTLRVVDATGSGRGAGDEDFDARITLRLPPSLKNLIEDSATSTGDSVNSWVVDALSRRAATRTKGGGRVTEGFDL